MEARQILITLHNRYNGDWDMIYNHIANKLELGELDLTNSDNLITILDSDYPGELKQQNRPPFVITKEQSKIKTYQITFKVVVNGINDKIALDNAIDKLLDGDCDYQIKLMK